MPIRTATLSDAPVLAAIEAECFPAEEAATPAQIAERLSVYPNHFLLLEEEGQVVAFADGFCTDQRDLTDEMFANPCLHNEAGAWQMIFGLNTLPAYRRRGCAARLMRAMASQAISQGRRGLVLTCKEALLPFYASLGYADEGVCASTHGGAVWHQMRQMLDDKHTEEDP